MPEVIIHRGTRTIGGSCVEISTGTERIVLDLGMPLMTSGGGELDQRRKAGVPTIESGILPEIEGLYHFQEKPLVSAVILSHPHIDHYGLIDFVHPEIPVYISPEAKALIETCNIFYPQEMIQKEFLARCHTFRHWERFKTGGFDVTSMLADHSAFGSSSLLIESEGKKIFYTGDIRGHGRKKKLFENLVNHPVQGINCLVMEGTTLGAKHETGFDSEADVEAGMYDVFKSQDDISFVIAAGSNIDRLVSIYRATRKAGKILVIDLYQYCLLTCLKKFAPGLPPHKNDNLKVFFIKGHADSIVEKMGVQFLYECKPRQIKIEEIMRNPENHVLRVPLTVMKRVMKENTRPETPGGIKLIYSMWSGYLKKDSRYEEFCSENKISMKSIHTSGHAYSCDLQRLANALKPDAILPIHTLDGDRFKHYFDNVVRVEDGVPYRIR